MELTKSKLSQKYTYILLEKIRKELERYFDKEITNKELSNLLNQNDRYINTKYYRMRRGAPENFKYNSFISTKNSIKNILKSDFSVELKECFKKYEIYLKNRKDHSQSYNRFMNFHPFADINYFKEINTKEKAYWLGFIYADGAILKLINKTRNNKINERFVLSQNRKDRVLIYRFTRTLGLNIKQINYVEKSDSFEIKFRSHDIIKDLKNFGVFNQKSKIIQLPNLRSIELYYAFLLGYFDGDGEAGSTRVHSGSFTFLNQIKEFFNIEHKIQTKVKISKTGEKQVCYALSLGARLFNQMLNNYSSSLKRKRKHFKEYRREKIISQN